MSSVGATGGGSANVFLSLPGVQEAAKKGTVAPVDIQKLQAELSADKPGKSAASERISGVRKEQFASDIKDNAGLVSALRALKINPSPEGLDRVAGAAIGAKGHFTNLVSATTTATLAMGKSKGANDNMIDALKNFKDNAPGVRATDNADMAYAMARIMMTVQQTEREQAMTAIKEALDTCKQQLQDLQAQKSDLEAHHDKGGGKGHDSGPSTDKGGDGGGKSHAAGGAKGGAAASEASSAQKVEELDKKIDAMKDTIKNLEKQLQAGQTANKDQVNDLILMLVEKIMQLSQANQAGKPGAGATPTPAK